MAELFIPPVSDPGVWQQYMHHVWVLLDPACRKRKGAGWLTTRARRRNRAA